MSFRLAIDEKQKRHRLHSMTVNLQRDARKTAAAHVRAANYWRSSHIALGLVITILSAVVSASIFTEYEYLSIIGAGLSLVLVVFSAVSTFLNPDRRKESHYKAFTLYRGIAARARALDEVDSVIRKKDLEYLCETYEQLLKEMDEARKGSPMVASRYFKRDEDEEKEGETKSLRENDKT